MNRRLHIGLGVLVGVGGFVDIGHIVFATKAGAKFGYGLLWAVALGVFGLIVFSEMAIRVSAVSKKAPFDIVRAHYSHPVGVATLVGSLVAGLLVSAAEIGGVALVLRMLTGWEYLPLVLMAAAALVIVEWVLPSHGFQRVFGYLGLGMAVFVIAMFASRPDSGEVLAGFVPGHGRTGDPLTYAYLAVGMIAATLMPYQVYFRSSLDAENRRALKRLPLDRLISVTGSMLGSLLVVGIVVVAAGVLGSREISPEQLSSAVRGPAVSLGKAGLFATLFGMLFSIGGAALRTSSSAAYSLSECLGRGRGKRKRPGLMAWSTLTWFATFAVATGVVATGIDVFRLTELAVVLSAAMMPLTYLPVLRLADDRKAMGEHVNGPVTRALGWLVFVLIVAVALTAVPLMILTTVGRV